jgi:hypothetical protein
LALSLGVRDYKVIGLRMPGLLEGGTKIFCCRCQNSFQREDFHRCGCSGLYFRASGRIWPRYRQFFFTINPALPLLLLGCGGFRSGTIYRWGVLNLSGTWVPTKLEINDIEPRKLPYGSYIVITLPPGEITLSATDMRNLHYSDINRMTLRERVNAGEILYFRLTHMFGRICTDMYDFSDLNENVRLGKASSATYYPRPDWPQTSCFQRVPEVIALKNLMNLRSAD